MKGAGINVVQTALGHSDPVTTLKYYAAAVEKSKVTYPPAKPGA